MEGYKQEPKNKVKYECGKRIEPSSLVLIYKPNKKITNINTCAIILK